MNAILIQSPHPDFDSFLAGASKLFGKSIATKADNCRLALSDAEKFRMCLSEFQDRDGPELNHHLPYSVMLYAQQHDLLTVLSICGMPSVVAETTHRGVYAAVVTGSLTQWQAAIKAGLTTDVGVLFNNIANLFPTSQLRLT